MKDLLHGIGRSGSATQVMLQSATGSLTRTELLLSVQGLARRFGQLDLQCIALFADNGIDWILTDLACQAMGIRIVPLPLFFTVEQISHALRHSGADALVTDQADVACRLDANLVAASQQPFTGSTTLYRLAADRSALVSERTQKITFTSGTTGTPRGVCLSADQQLTVAAAVATAVNCEVPRHLCVLPLSTLLENLAGVYAPLLSGGTVIAPPLAAVGMTGSSGLDTDALLSGICDTQPDTLILVPELLVALTTAAECGWRPPPSLHFVAVGGGKVSPQLLHRARRVGLPVYEGYGLSECASVVTLNVPAADRPGSVGRPLPHVDVTVEDGEIVVSGSEFLGYAGLPETWNAGPVRSGDLGHIDEDGFVVVSGRAKNQLITSFGRNVSPEWVESELTAGPLLQQAFVVGDGRPYCVALVCPRDPTATTEAIDALIRDTNQRLPDYARVLDWHFMPAPALSRNGMLTANGKPRRSIIEEHYAVEIEFLYSSKTEVSNQ